MANEQNLRPSEYKFTKEDSAKGGRKSGETKRRRKQLKEAFDVLLSKGFTDRHGNQITGVEALAAKVFQQALDGDLAAAKMVRDIWHYTREVWYDTLHMHLINERWSWFGIRGMA